MTNEIVNELTGEIIVTLNRAEARALLDSVKINLADTAELIEQLWAGRGWLALGYGSWDELVEAEIRGIMPKLERAERKQVHAKLAETGMSTRAIGRATGYSEATVRRDLPGASNDAPERSTGVDGKSYPRSRPAPAAPVKRRPLQEPWDDAVRDLLKAAEKLQRLSGDDRFAKANLDIKFVNYTIDILKQITEIKK